MNGNVIRTITIRGTSEGLDKLEADLKKVAAAEQNVAIVSEQSAKRVLSLEDAWKRQTLKLDEAARAQANIARETKIADAALREGLATQTQHAQRLEQINQRYNLVTQSTQKFGQQTGLASHELVNLGRQAQDVGVSLASGQSPLMVLVQQGSQIADVFISSGKSVGGFFNQAIAWARPFVMSTAGIVTGIAAIGAAAVYAAVQFGRASTTIEQALENEIRLLKEAKALIDARTSAEARAQLNPKDLTEYELKRNLLDVQRKLNEETRAALIRTAPSRNIGDIVRGEVAGDAPLTPGMDKVMEATAKLKAAQAAGLPGMKEYNAELGRIATAHPELAKTVDKMIELGRTGIDLENAEMRLRAISDALKGVATDAQMAAVGLNSVAQFKMNNAQAEEGRAIAERRAVAELQLLQIYGTQNIEVARQLQALQGQLSVAQQVTGLGQINAQHQASITASLAQGKTLTDAIALADAQRAVSLAQVNTEADRTLRSLREEGELIRASSREEKDRIKVRQEYNRLIESGVDSQKAGAIAAEMSANARSTRDAEDQAQADADAAAASQRRAQANEQAAAAAQQEAVAYARMKAEMEEMERIWKNVPIAFSGTKIYTRDDGTKTVNNPAGYGYVAPINEQLYAGYESKYGPGGYSAEYKNLGQDAPLIYVAKPNTQGIEYQINQSISGGVQSAIDNLLGSGLISGQSGGIDKVGSGMDVGVQSAALGALSRLTNLLPDDQKAGVLQRQIGVLQGQPTTLANQEAIKSLTDQLEQLTKATVDNTSATQTMTDVLSPFYSSDPRRTHLGFRAFAGGGIMTAHGMLPLHQYDGGGIANSPQVSVFGEGSTPEAYVPVPSGRIPVEVRGVANNNQRPVVVTINVQGNADANTVSALKATAFQQAQAMRRAMAG